jgi:regulatory protein
MPKPYSINDLINDLAPDGEGDRFANPAEARRKAMDYLARREYAAGELCDKLVRFGFDAGIAAAVVEQLTVDGLQSDARFVESFVHVRINQGKGPLRIRAELAERGIAAAIADEALDGSGEDWIRLARAVRERKFGRRLPNQFTEKARQMRFLQYRGFEPEQVRAAMADGGA